ncbi:hypothetical protein K439DRAFT_1666010 [Ramaria rubella]|nr:hypothetical protein K439DRAFT_1666010 [Ramaria rubella]
MPNLELLHATNAVGTATTGSSEAIQLGGLAMKRIWQEKRKAAGKSTHEPGPNVIMGVCITVLPASSALTGFSSCANAQVVIQNTPWTTYVDENTIGHYEAETGHSVPIHVDASDAFVTPLATPKLQWDFDLPRVVSTNTSRRKFGLVYIGVYTGIA